MSVPSRDFQRLSETSRDMRSRKESRTMTLPRMGALLVVLPALAGCCGPQEPTTPTEDRLDALRSAYGGRERWERHAGVRFSYELKLPPESPGLEDPEALTTTVSFAEVAFRLGDYHHLWVTPREDGTPIRLELDSEWGALVRELRAVGVGIEAEGPARERALARLELGLRSIRYFFQLPLGSTLGRWQFHSLLAPPTHDVSPALDLVPLEPGAPLGACLLFLEPESYLIVKAVYVLKDGPLGRQAVQLDFDGHEVVEGVRVPVARRHVRVPEAQPGFRRKDPFGLDPPEPAPDASVLLQERVTRVAFLDGEALDRKCPLPETPAEETAGEPLDGSGSGP
jgi:hypothetical protein